MGSRIGDRNARTLDTHLHVVLNMTEREEVILMIRSLVLAVAVVGLIGTATVPSAMAQQTGKQDIRLPGTPSPDRLLGPICFMSGGWQYCI